MKNIKNNIALYSLIIGILLTFSHTARAQDVPDNFDPNANNTVFSIAVQTNGKILIGGDFTTLNGGTVTRNRIARLGFAPTAASVSVSGRITDGKRGISNAVIYLTDANGNTQATRTSSFGYYRFDDIEVGQNVIIQVSARRYSFAPQVVTVNEELANLNFTAQ